MTVEAPSGQHVINAAGRRMVDVLRDEIRTSNEAMFCVAFVKSAGLQLLLVELRRMLDRGGTLRLLTSTYMGQTEPQALRSVLRMPNTELRIQDGPKALHAKVFLFTRHEGPGRLWVGSSNLTRSGLALNTEWNVLHDDHRVIAEARQVFEQLWSRADVRPVDEAFIGLYSLTRRALYDPPDAPVGAAGPTPNSAQIEALRRLRELRAEGARRALVIAAPGVGKTLLAAFDARQLDARTVLFLAHRKDIVDQAATAFRQVFGTGHRQSVWMEGVAPDSAAFVFATVQSFVALLRRGDPRARARFDHVVIDEFHHAAAEGWQKVLQGIDAGFLLGLTATPERADGREVMELCDWNIAYELRLPEAIREGFLLPFHYFGIADDLVDYARIPWARGRFDVLALESAVMLEERVTEILRHTEEKGFDGPKRVAVGFCAGIRHARYMCDQLRARGHGAESLTGEDDLARRHEVYARLQDPSDPLEWLFVADVLNEGVDLPAINVVAFLRPTESLGLFVQQLGRGLRRTPGTSVLTVLDFVGQHRNALLALRGLHDPAGVPSAAHRELRAVLGFDLVAPPGCEIILEDRTLEVLRRIGERSVTRADRAREAYERLRAELQRAPRPIDFWDRADVPSFTMIRDAFKGWRQCRLAMGDAETWERGLSPDGPLDKLLHYSERNWQCQRVVPYVALWAAVDVKQAIEAAFEAFFIHHPQWKAERPKSIKTADLWGLLQKDLPRACFNGQGWTEEIRDSLGGTEVVNAVRERLLPSLASDYRVRHGGVLRRPEDLRLHAAYARPEIINYFGVQYDPTLHNKGVLDLGDGNFVLISKLDTHNARKAYQYENKLLEDRRFLWTSQNRQRRDNDAGRDIVEHRVRMHRLHLFVQPASSTSSRYLGEVSVASVTGDGPMRVTFVLATPVPGAVREALEGLHFDGVAGRLEREADSTERAPDVPDDPESV